VISQFEFDALSRLYSLDVNDANPLLGTPCLASGLGAVSFGSL